MSDDLEKRLEEAAKRIAKIGDEIKQQVEEALEKMKALGLRMIDEQPRYGAGGARIAFVHPKTAGGVLLELSERP